MKTINTYLHPSISTHSFDKVYYEDPVEGLVELETETEEYAAEVDPSVIHLMIQMEDSPFGLFI
jgi:hypothetical protein